MVCIFTREEDLKTKSKTMKLFVLSFMLFFAAVSSFSDDMTKDDEWVKKYFTKLQKSYDKRVAPIGEHGIGSPIKVAITMYILDISEVDDSNMDYTAQFYFRQTWQDPRLKYTDKNEVIKLRNADDLWTPDIFFTGGRESRLEAIIHPNKMLKIKPDGEVFYSIRVTVKFACSMDLSYFPHDTQKCLMRIESYSHTKKDVDIEWLKPKISVGFSKEINLHNFQLIEIDQSERVENFTTGQYKILQVDLIFERKFGLFAIKLYIPFIFLMCISLLSLWISPKEKVIRFSLLVLIIYIMTNIVSEVSRNIPDAPYTKGSDVWIGFCMSLVFAIFLEFIYVALTTSKKNSEVSEKKSEILMDIEKDLKEESMKTNSLKSHLCKWVNMFDARNGGKGKRDASAHPVDKIFRILFPLIFVLFNVVYWPAYCCKSIE